MARNPLYSPCGPGNEERIDTSTPFEIPGLFSEIEGITSQINAPFEDENQLISVGTVPDEAAEDTSVGELTFTPTTSLDTEKCEASFIDVCDYIQLLEHPKLFAYPEKRRREVENKVSEI